MGRYLRYFAYLSIMALGVFFACLSSPAGPNAADASEDRKDSPLPRRPALDKPKAAAEEPPDEDKIFVWPAPDEGDQTVFILKVTGPDTAEAAYLVPFALQVQTGGKATQDELSKKLAGRLIHVRLKGRNPGGVKGRVWLGKDEGGWLDGAK